MLLAPWPSSKGLSIAALIVLSTGAAAQEPPPGDPPKEPAPVARADDLRDKLSVTGYFVDHDQQLDLNARRRQGPVVGWAGLYLDHGGPSQGRIGAEYDYQRGAVLVVPTLNLGTNRVVAGSLYAELGGKVYGIAGYAVTNLKPFYSLSFDPNDSVQVGAGWHVSSYDRLTAFTIADVRLHTQQQDTHVLWRHKLSSSNGLTVDGLFKSGRTDAGNYVRGVGVGVYYDRPRSFYKLYWDPYVNFTHFDMLRIGTGVKF